MFTSRQFFHSEKLVSSIKEVGPFMPAFAQSTSIFSQSFLMFLKRDKTLFSSLTSRQDFFQVLGQFSNKLFSLSTIHTSSPFKENSSAIAFPIPEAPAVIRIFLDNLLFTN